MNILIISPSWIGDTVISHSLYRLIFIKYHKQVKIDVIAPKWCKSVIDHMPEVNTILITPYNHGSLNVTKFYKIIKFIKYNKYHQAIILPNSWKSAIIPFLSKIPIRTGWKGEIRYGLLNDLRILDKLSLPLLVQRYAALAYDNCIIKNFSDFPQPFPLPNLSIKIAETQKVLYKFNLNNKEKKLIALCPGSAYGPSKNWPHYHYITVALQLIYNGYHIVILGSNQEKFIKQLINHSALKNFQQNCYNFIGDTSLNEAMIIISVCNLIISNDSGLMHIACALQRPVVGIYDINNFNKNFNPPLFKKSKIVHNLYLNQDNQNCHNLYKYHKNLINISPHQVLQASQNLLR